MALKATPKDLYNRARQQEAIKAGRCINGKDHDLPELDGATGKRKIRCNWCHVVHAVGRERALELADDHPDNPQPPRTARYGWRRGAT